MDSELFIIYVQKLDKTFSWKDKIVALILNNFVAYPEIEKLKTTKLEFLAPTATANQFFKKLAETHRPFKKIANINILKT